MPNHSYLPATHEGNSFGELTPAGAWQSRSNTQLGALASALLITKVAQEAGQVHKLHSIPNPWARVILFNAALNDPAHLLNRQTVGEWRGLLAMLALREVRGLHGLQMQEVDLKLGKTGSFAKVLRDLKPLDIALISPDTTWDEFYLFRWKRENPGERAAVIGMASPMTLVATAAEYKGMIETGVVPWFDGTILRDPLPYLTLKEKTALAEWTTHVLDSVSAGPDSPQKKEIIHRLNEFLAALKAQGAIVTNAQVADTLLAENEWGLTGIFDAISKPHSGESDFTTELEIVGNLPRPAIGKVGDVTVTGHQVPPRWVLVDVDVTDKFPGKKATDIAVYKSKTLETMLRRVEQKSPVTSDLIAPATDKEAAWRWCTKEYFFEDFLVYEQTLDPAASPFVGCVAARDKTDPQKVTLRTHNTILFPLREEVVKLFSPKYLSDNFEVKWESDSVAVCTLTLKLQQVSSKSGQPDPAQQPKLFKLEKRYSTTGGDGDGWLEPRDSMRSFPVVGIWPNFRSEGQGKNRWRQYYLFESWAELLPPDGSPEALTQDFFVEPVDDGSGLKQKPRVVVMDGEQASDTFRVQPMSDFPQFLKCSMLFSKSAARLSDKDRPRALLILNPPRQATEPTESRTAVLGIDFGTTGTAIYYSPNAADPAPRQMVFQDRFVPVVTSLAGVNFASLIRRQFVPNETWGATNKILSVLQEFRPTPGTNDRIAVRDSHVMYANPDHKDYFSGRPESIVSDLKWGANQQAAIDFLTQICIQAFAELVYEGASKIELRYSYPTAFTDDQVNRFHLSWRSVLKMLRGAESKVAGQPKFPDAITSAEIVVDSEESRNYEALAATRFFGNEGEPPLAAGSGALTFDIGGGTTDLAIWSKPKGESKLAGHLSVKFAGRNIFRDPLNEHLEMLGMILPTIRIENLLKSKDSARLAQLDATIAGKGTELLEGLNMATTGGAKHSVEAFLAIVELGLCGLAFYSGLLLGELIAEKEYVPNPKLFVYVGGNGCRLLEWCGVGDFSRRSPIHRRFASSLLAGSRIADPEPGRQTEVQISLSTKPKEEVAYGLVASGERFKMKQAELGQPTTLPAAGDNEEDVRVSDQMEGEGFSIDGEMKSWKQRFISEELLNDRRIAVDPAMTVFKAFLESLDPATQDVEKDESSLKLMADQVDKCIEETAELMRKNKSRNEPLPDRVPLFFVALNELIERRVKSWKRIKIDAN